MAVPRITPFLWFDHEAEEAANFYVSVFSARAGSADRGSSKVLGISRYTEAGPGRADSVMTVSFMLDGQEFTALNGGPRFAFTEAVSFVVNCETQQEVDELWEALSDGGEKGRCGWLKDRYGLSWQIVPTALGELASDPDAAKSQRVMEAMLEMDKLDIEGLRRAYEGQ